MGSFLFGVIPSDSVKWSDTGITLVHSVARFNRCAFSTRSLPQKGLEMSQGTFCTKIRVQSGAGDVLCVEAGVPVAHRQSYAIAGTLVAIDRMGLTVTQCLAFGLIFSISSSVRHSVSSISHVRWHLAY
ncbi:hypothetical protein PISMIDRAFT_684617, partial [Pisolithus microcarpus 441]